MRSMAVTGARTAAALIHLVSRVLAVVSIIGMACVMVLVVYDVFLRTSGQRELRGLVEYAEIGLVLTAFFALGETERRRDHVSVTAILGRLRGAPYVVTRLAGGFAAAAVAVLLAWASYDVLADSLARGEYKLGLVRLPMWPARAAVFAGFLLLALEQVVTAVEDISHARREAAEAAAEDPSTLEGRPL